MLTRSPTLTLGNVRSEAVVQLTSSSKREEVSQVTRTHYAIRAKFGYGLGA